ncbi:MAG: class I SAM-dependent methyltransferase [Actinomycetota bacterium]|nr:class I SAM-dependent methyltransferase [Actinomycetota bacterium]
MSRWRRRLRAAAHWLGARGRQLGVLPYQPERWTTDRWDAAYGEGSLDYYGQLDELPRYSIIAGYVGWFAAARRGSRPRVIDVGCGTGLLRERLDGETFAEYVGVDVSHVAIQAASARGLPRSRFVVGEIPTLDLGRFDVAVLNEVLYYEADASSFLTNLRSLLEPDAIVIISMWRHAGDRILWRRVNDVFPILDRVEARNRANAINPRGWVIACCRAEPSGARR